MNFNNLPNDKFLGAATQYCDILSPFEPAGFDLFAQRKAAFTAATQGVDDAYKPSAKDFTTDDMHKADDLRDDYIKAVRAILLGYTLLPDESPLKRIAQEMYQVFKDYNFSTGDSYTGESVKMDNMMQVFAQNQSKLELLGVWALLQTAMDYNAQVKAYFATRIENLAERVVGEMRDARSALEQAYQQLCEVIDAMLVLAPSAELSTVERRMNALVDYYKQYYIRTGSGSGSGSSGSSSGSGSTNSGSGASGETGGTGESGESGGTGESGESGGTGESGETGETGGTGSDTPGGDDNGGADNGGYTPGGPDDDPTAG